MKIRDILELTCVLLQKNELINTGIFYKLHNDYVEKHLQTNKELQMLMRCANLVVKEVATEFVPLMHKQTITSHNGQISYAEFDKLLLDVASIKDLNGEVVTAYTFPDHIAIEDGTFVFRYAYIPTDKSFFEDIDDKKTDSKIFAYGTAAEYCLIKGDYNNALYWERRYKDALYNATSKDTAVILPKRRWG